MRDQDLSDVERALQAKYDPNVNKPFQSTAVDPKSSEYVKALALPRDKRGQMPLTQEKFVISEDPVRVEWERELRIFLDALVSRNGHRISAPMVFEWVTGISIKELAEIEGVANADGRGGGRNGSANSHLRHLNYLMKAYFGNSYKTTIAGRSVGKAYTVPPGFRVKRQRPVCLTLWPEYENGTLEA